MKISLPCCSYLLVLFVLAPSWGCGQVAESHSVERLERDELGPYDPEHKPDLSAVEQRIVDQTNAFREEQGREPVQMDETLTKTAEAFAQFMARTDKYGHRADDRNPSERAKAQGYEYCMVSENIAYQFKTTGYTTEELTEGFVTGWKNSPGHRKNMLERHVTETGVGVAQSESTGVFYAVQMFGRPNSEQIEFRLVNKTDVDFKYRIGDKQFSLPPNYARRHTLCQPSSLRWLPELKSEGSEEAESQQKPRSIKPGDGEEFRVEIQEGQVLVQPIETEVTETE